jgi:hypothetical protein
MNGAEILNFFRMCDHMINRLGGIVAIDQLPRDGIRNKNILIVNTDLSHNPGLHWVCIYIDESGPSEYFDPLGFPPCHYSLELENFLINTSNSYYKIKTPVQHKKSDSCGHFCLYYAYYRSLNYPMRDIVSDFHPILLLNEYKVRRFYQKTLYKVRVEN